MAATGLSSGGDKKKRGNKFLCGTPHARCTGGQSSIANSLKGAKTHSTSEEAFKCYARYLLAEGYTQLGPREFSKNGGPIQLLTKKCRFGARCRGGKGNRYMPEQFNGGTMISC